MVTDRRRVVRHHRAERAPGWRREDVPTLVLDHHQGSGQRVPRPQVRVSVGEDREAIPGTSHGPRSDGQEGDHPGLRPAPFPRLGKRQGVEPLLEEPRRRRGTLRSSHRSSCQRPDHEHGHRQPRPQRTRRRVTRGGRVDCSWEATCCQGGRRVYRDLSFRWSPWAEADVGGVLPVALTVRPQSLRTDPRCHLQLGAPGRCGGWSNAAAMTIAPQRSLYEQFGPGD